jgi:hypothetical protein
VRRLLLPLLAAFSLPTAVNAESHWLVLQLARMNNGGHGAYALEKFEVSSQDSCFKQGQEWADSHNERNFWCIRGK